MKGKSGALRRSRLALACGAITIAIIGAIWISRGAAVQPNEPLRLINGISRTRRIRRGEVHRYSVVLPRSSFATLEVDQREIDLSLHARDSRRFTNVDLDFGPYGMETMSIASEDATRFSIAVRAASDSTSIGSYNIRLSQRSRRAEDDDRLLAQSAFATAGQQGVARAEALAEAVRLYGVAADLWHRTGDRWLEASALHQRGTTFDRMSRWEDAYNCYKGALAIWESVHYDYGRLQTLLQITRLAGHLDQDFSSLPSEADFLESWTKLGDRRGIAESLGALTGHLMRSAHTPSDYRQVISYGEKATALYRSLGDPNERKVLETLVLCYRELNELDRALQLSEKILAMNKAVGDERGEAASLDRLGTMLRKMGKNRESATYYEEALKRRHAQGDVSAELAMHLALAWIRIDLNEPELALEHARMAQLLEEQIRSGLRTFKWREGFSDEYNVTATTARAFMARSRAPNDQDSLRAFLLTDRAYGRLSSPSAAGIDAIGLPQIQQELLDPETVLLEYLPSGGEFEGPKPMPANRKDQSYVWAVSRESFQAYELPPRPQIETLVHEVYRSVSDHGNVTGSSTDSNGALQALGRLLLGPVATVIAGKKLMIACGGLLEYVPFAALPDPSTQDHAPLAQNHDLKYISSALGSVSFQRTHAESPRARHLLALIGDPVFGRGELRHPQDHQPTRLAQQSELARAVRAFGFAPGTIPRLVYARREANWIKQIASRDDPRELLDVSATREAFFDGSLADYRIIHVATHGFINDQEPDLSGLVFSLVNRHGDPVDGFLRLRDLYALRLQTDLVVLSACDSALGRVIHGEGMLSLTNGFLYAGAGAVLSTIWKVDDEATAEFMKRFYLELLRAHRSPETALRYAQLQLAAEPRWRSPYYWAGFVMYGQEKSCF